MSAKRALVVDDSKSARAFLARMLERYEIEVDTAESAEQAIDYLTRARPDVIFMDHLMPGMDGFQAVQTIKNNPHTATIPIMMYTSQEGELYLGQARALGAIGVLPKQIKPTDVSKVLYDLHLVADRRTGEGSAFTPFTVVPAANAETAATGEVRQLDAVAAMTEPAPLPEHAPFTPLSPLTPEIRAVIENTVRAELAELRRSQAVSSDAQADRIVAEVRAALPPPVRPSTSPLRWIAASLALATALLFAWLWRQESAQRAELETRLVQLQTERAPEPAKPVVSTTPVEATVAATAPDAGAAESAAATSPPVGALLTPITEFVPFGEVPLAGARLDGMRTLLERLAARDFNGIIEITTYAGRYCLTGSSTEGYKLAAEDTLQAQCDLVGNPPYDALSPAARQSMAFANLAAEFRKSSAGALDVRVVSGDLRALEPTYPAVDEQLTAGQWNKVASANNRIEIRLRPVS
ncbi:MAG: response regulator [Steroidobacteraceae bacterium]